MSAVHVATWVCVGPIRKGMAGGVAGWVRPPCQSEPELPPPPRGGGAVLGTVQGVCVCVGQALQHLGGGAVRRRARRGQWMPARRMRLDDNSEPGGQGLGAGSGAVGQEPLGVGGLLGRKGAANFDRGGGSSAHLVMYINWVLFLVKKI